MQESTSLAIFYCPLNAGGRRGFHKFTSVTRGLEGMLVVASAIDLLERSWLLIELLNVDHPFERIVEVSVLINGFSDRSCDLDI